MRKKRGRGGENKAEGKGRVGEEETEEEEKSRKMEEQRVTEEKKAENEFPRRWNPHLPLSNPPALVAGLKPRLQTGTQQVLQEPRTAPPLAPLLALCR